MNLKIDLSEMKKKITIESNLLDKINIELKKYSENLIFYHKNYSLLKLNIVDNNSDFIELNNLIKFNSKFLINKLDYFIEKLFNYIEQIYWIFKYFHNKKKDYIGMNLTGLVNDRIETGIGFRNSIILMNSNQINLNTFLKKFIDSNKTFDTTTNSHIYKIKSNNFKWIEFNLEIYNYFYLIINLDKKQYSIFFEK